METKMVQRVTVVGAGLMGHGIGQRFAQAGHPVVFYDTGESILRQAVERVHRNLKEMVEWEILPERDVEATLARIQTATALERAIDGADLVIEAVVEDLALKHKIFEALSEVCAPHTILASNTSTIMPSTLASFTRCPERVLVAHYFFPPHLMPLVEIVPNPRTSEEAVQVVYELVKHCGQVPVMVRKEALGFIANRLGFALMREALHIVEQGIATAQEVDAVVTNSFARRYAVRGPFECLEAQSSWDVVANMVGYLFHDLDTSQEVSPVLVGMIERGELGSKTGRGFYDWPEGRVEAWRAMMARAMASHVRIIDEGRDRVEAGPRTQN